MRKTLGFSSLLLSAMAFGSFGIWIRLLNKEVSVYQQIVLRNGVAFILALLLVLATKQLKTIDWKSINKQNLLLYTFLIPLAVVAYNIAIIDTKIAVATFAFYVGTILTGWIGGVLFFNEKLTKDKWVSLILVIIGLCLFAYPFNKLSIGLIAGIVSGILDGSANGFRKDLSGKVSKIVLVLLTGIGGVIVSGILIVIFKEELNFLPALSSTGWLVGIVFGALLVLLNYLLLIGFQNFDLSLGAIVLSLELLFALLFGILFLKEFPTTLEIAGGTLILIANILPNIKSFVTKA